MSLKYFPGPGLKLEQIRISQSGHRTVDDSCGKFESLEDETMDHDWGDTISDKLINIKKKQDRRYSDPKARNG